MSEKLASAEARQAAHKILTIPLQKRTEETMAQAIADSYAAVVRERDKLLRVLMPDAWFDDETYFDSPESFVEECDLKVGEEFDLTASVYWKEKYRVTKLPDDTNDDVEVEKISGGFKDPEPYASVLKRADELVATLRAIYECGSIKEAERLAEAAIKSATPKQGGRNA